METATIINPPTRKHSPFPKLVIIAGSMIVALIGFLIVWNNGLRDGLFPKNFGVVEPGKLYRSGQISHWQIRRMLANNHIAVIVALSAHGGKTADLDAETQAVNDLGIDREIFPLGGDGTGQISRYADAIVTIDRAEKAGKPVLVHCIAGAQRTGGVIATYEMLVKHAPAQIAYAQMRAYGHDPTANPHLLEYLNSHMAELAQLLVDRHVIDRVPNPLPVLISQ